MQAKGPVAEDDTSLWGCLKRIEDARTGKPLSRKRLSAEMAGMVLGALDTTSMTSAITLCALLGLMPARVLHHGGQRYGPGRAGHHQHDQPHQGFKPQGFSPWQSQRWFWARWTPLA